MFPLGQLTNVLSGGQSSLLGGNALSGGRTSLGGGSPNMLQGLVNSPLGFGALSAMMLGGLATDAPSGQGAPGWGGLTNFAAPSLGQNLDFNSFENLGHSKAWQSLIQMIMQKLGLGGGASGASFGGLGDQGSGVLSSLINPGGIYG